MTKLITAVVTTALLVLVTLTGGLAAITNSPAGCVSGDLTAGQASLVRGGQPVHAWDADQLANARVVLTVGAQLGVAARGQVIALATAIQESSLRNLPGGDRDSLGLFQQRPSAGWGTRTQILDPSYAATRFYRALLTVPGWQTMPLTQAAQNVQRSAYPLPTPTTRRPPPNCSPS